MSIGPLFDAGFAAGRKSAEAEVERLRASQDLLRAALIDAISYADDATHPHAQYQDARPSLMRVLDEIAIVQQSGQQEPK